METAADQGVSPKESTAVAALAGVDEGTAALLDDCFRQFGISTVVVLPDELSCLEEQPFHACVLPLDESSEPVLATIRRSPHNAHSVVYGICGSVKQAREFAQKNGAWIAARLRRLPDAMPFAHGTLLPLRGVSHRIDHRKSTRGTVWIETGADMPLLCVAGKAPHLSRRVRDFLKREAKRDLETASGTAAQALGVTVKRVSVRDQSSRWGSCSSTGVLSYSWRLILAPSFVLDYLAVHEVTHLIEMNHSRRFWRLVEKTCPDMARAKACSRTGTPEEGCNCAATARISEASLSRPE